MPRELEDIRKVFAFGQKMYLHLKYQFSICIFNVVDRISRPSKSGQCQPMSVILKLKISNTKIELNFGHR